MKYYQISVVVACLLFVSAASASNVTLPHTFQANKTAKAAEVNANFSAAATGINDNDSRVSALEAAVNALQTAVAGLQTENTALKARLDTLEAADLDNRVTVLENAGTSTTNLDNRVTALEGAEIQKLNAFLEIHETQPADTRLMAPIVRITGANLQVVNGTGSQDSINGLGNFQVGYGKTSFGSETCSDGYYQTQVDCENNGAVWDGFHVSGSHNLIGGTGNYYSQTGGLIFGKGNVINRPYAAALGGAYNQSSADEGVVVGGNNNIAMGSQTTSGSTTLTHGRYVVLVGGQSNKIGSNAGVVVGGFQNDIQSSSNSRNVIVGGRQNIIKGEEDRDSIIVGGSGNTLNATDTQSLSFANGNVLVGGSGNEITSRTGNEPDQSVVVGGTGNNMQHDQSVITGEENVTSSEDKLVEP